MQAESPEKNDGIRKEFPPEETLLLWKASMSWKFNSSVIRRTSLTHDIRSGRSTRLFIFPVPY